MKKWLLILVAIFGFASTGSAQKIDVGFHFGSNPYFGAIGGNLGIAFSNTIGLRIDLDLALATGGGGALNASFGIDANLIFRFPLSPGGSDLYIGPGLFLGVEGGNAKFGIGALLGIEIQLAPKVGYFVETSPLFIAFSNPVGFFLRPVMLRSGLNFYL
jgi:hypothetical protein